MEMLPLHITPLACEHIKSIMQTKNIASGQYGLRVGMKGNGCGATFLLGFDKIQATDNLYQLEDFSVFIDKKHLMYVLGLEIDYEETENGSGFTFHNPNAL
jgi:iron-sulfur cluster assembly protein